MKLRIGKNSRKGQVSCLMAFFAVAISFHHPPSEIGMLIKEDAIPYHQNISQAAEQEKIPPDPGKGLGVQDLPKADGGKDKVYYSITTPEEETKSQQEEKEKADKSWDMLRNIIIDTRPR